HLVPVGAVEDPDAAGLGQAAVADHPVVGDPHSVVVVDPGARAARAGVVRLADADAAGDHATVVLQHVVGQPDVVDRGLELNAAGAVTLTGGQADPVDPGAVEGRGQ